MTASPLFNDQPPQCPMCGHHAPLPLIYGDPSAEMRDAAKLGKIALANEVQLEAPAEWFCQEPHCRFTF